MNYKELLKRIITEIEKANSIVILRHRKPDPDALGSQIGLSKLIKGAYPNKSVYVIGDMPENLKYIGDMDKIPQEVFDNSLIIVVDCSTPRLINCPFEVNVDEVIKIDHHPNVTSYGKICYVDTTAASASEIMAEFAFDETTPFQMDRAAANVIYAGIIGDTGRFLYPSTTSKTFSLVSKLIQYEVDLAGIADKMITKPLNVNRMTGYIYEHLEVSPEGMASVVLTKEVLQFLERLKGFWLGVCMWNKKMVTLESIYVQKAQQLITLRKLSEVEDTRLHAEFLLSQIPKFPKWILS